MFTEIIKLIPILDKAALNSMFQNLDNRFTSVAKKFGAGMKNALKFGGISALVGGLVAKLLNPLEKAEAIIDKLLNKGSDAQTYAQEFNSTPGKVLRLQTLGQVHGLDAEQLRGMVSKFQGALAKEQEAQLAPARIEQKLTEATPEERPALLASLKAAREEAAKGGVLHEFLNEKDIIVGFFKFVQSLQAVGKVDKSRQTAIETEVLGERQRGKASEFLNATDFGAILAKAPSEDAFNAAAKRTGDLADQKNFLTAMREGFDFVTKANLVNEKQVNGLNVAAGLSDQADNETLKRFDATLSTSIAIQKLEAKFDQFTTDFVNTIAPDLVTGINTMAAATPLVLDGVKQLAQLAKDNLPSIKTLKEISQPVFDGIVGFIAGATVHGGDILNTPGGIGAKFATAQQKFTDFVTPVDSNSYAVPKQTHDELQGNLNTFADRIDGITGRIEAIWAEFKSSRIYRTFGGGGDN